MRETTAARGIGGERAAGAGCGREEITISRNHATGEGAEANAAGWCVARLKLQKAKAAD
ncbi:MAG: hypothetical protein DHS20C04_09880 [Hyphococcus sp.]|nr:MAG: hypothetical protein DHS20C04_09880 [Marinicaulis sp.]